MHKRACVPWFWLLPYAQTVSSQILYVCDHARNLKAWARWSPLRARETTPPKTTDSLVRMRARKGGGGRVWFTRLVAAIMPMSNIYKIEEANETPLFGNRKCLAPSCAHPAIEEGKRFLNHVMEHHWMDAHPPTPEAFIDLIINNPERALQVGGHIQRNLFNVDL